MTADYYGQYDYGQYDEQDGQYGRGRQLPQPVQPAPGGPWRHQAPPERGPYGPGGTYGGQATDGWGYPPQPPPPAWPQGQAPGNGWQAPPQPYGGRGTAPVPWSNQPPVPAAPPRSSRYFGGGPGQVAAPPTWPGAGGATTDQNGRVTPSRASRHSRQAEATTGMDPRRRRLIIAGVVVVAMIVCWFYIFPWLEKILPSEF